MEDKCQYIIHRKFKNSSGTIVSYTIETEDRLPESFKEELIELVNKYTDGAKRKTLRPDRKG
jgi:histone H3/H4